MLEITYEKLAQELLDKYPGKVDPLRLEKALSIARNRTMIYNSKCPPGQADVRSESGRGWYRVDLKAHTCTCMDSTQGHVCKHRLAAWLYLEQIDRTLEAAKQDGIRAAKKLEDDRRAEQARAAAINYAETREASDDRIKKYLHELGF